MIAFGRRGAFTAGVIILGLTSVIGATRAAEMSVGIDNFAFTPAVLTVPAGTKVIWINHDDIPHTVTSANPPNHFHSGPLDTDDSFGFTFDRRGTFSYFCALHPHMQGTVVVR